MRELWIHLNMSKKIICLTLKSWLIPLKWDFSASDWSKMLSWWKSINIPYAVLMKSLKHFAQILRRNFLWNTDQSFLWKDLYCHLRNITELDPTLLHFFFKSWAEADIAHISFRLRYLQWTNLSQPALITLQMCWFCNMLAWHDQTSVGQKSFGRGSVCFSFWTGLVEAKQTNKQKHTTIFFTHVSTNLRIWVTKLCVSFLFYNFFKELKNDTIEVWLVSLPYHLRVLKKKPVRNSLSFSPTK